jgi:pimeloyl-ACP methyl ester carboxylesterase
MLDAPARERGIAVVAADRPGYGASGHDRARTFGSAARDLGELLRRLGIERCAVVGLSGSCPTALGCAVRLDGVVSAVATIGGVAPLVPRDPSLPPDRVVTRIARRSETATRALLEVIVRSGRARPEKALARFEAMLAEPDAQLLRENPALRQAFLDDLRYASPSSARAAARDFWLFARRWDIDVADAKVPVHVWHGTLDRNVPVAHARVIAARCPTAELHLVEGGGHILFDQLDEIIAGVTTFPR